MELNPLFLPELSWKRPLLIAGPCSAETEKQVMVTAEQIADMGIKIFRAGIWKPRTKPGSFEGVGSKGLKWLRKVKQETGMYVSTEVATRKHVEDALNYNIDILWIGARTTANPFAVQEIAETLMGVDIPLFIKNPVNPDLELWIGALERLNNVGITRLAAIHRGFSSFDEKIYRNVPQWHIPIELKRRFPYLTIICDPSHIGGKRELVQPIAQQAMDMGFDGLFIESHFDPDNAWSDKEQQLDPSDLRIMLENLLIRDEKECADGLFLLRQEMDQLDEQLLELFAKRMRVSQEIGVFKRENNITVVQPGRYNDILNKFIVRAEEKGISSEFIKGVFEVIHEESVRQQIDILNK